MISQVIQQKNLVSTYPNRGLTFVEGQGAYLIDSKGEKYLDMMSNFGVNILGYSHPKIVEALKTQVSKIMNIHSSFANDARANATQKLISKMSKLGLKNLKRVYWSNSGAETVEAGIKFAILKTGRSKFLVPKNDYHGKTMGALSFSTSNGGKYQKGFEGLFLETDFFEFGNLEDFKTKIESDEYAGVVLEPIQGEGGIIIPEENFLTQVSKLCKEKGVLLLVDEVQTGVGRTGSFLNVEKYVESGFECDILCLSKALGGGMPVGATIVSEEVNQAIPKGVHTSTFGGNPLSLAGVLATLEIFDEPETLQKINQISKYLEEKLRDLQGNYSEQILKIRIEGLMVAIDLEEKIDALDFMKKMQAEKVLTAPTTGNAVRLLPPMVISESDVDFFVSAFEKVLSK
jgi:acetylornithine/LysW-gamma-L-lysine aminotransferase